MDVGCVLSSAWVLEAAAAWSFGAATGSVEFWLASGAEDTLLESFCFCSGCSLEGGGCSWAPCLLCVDRETDAVVLCTLAESSALRDSGRLNSAARCARNVSPNIFSFATDVEAEAFGGLGQDPYQLWAFRTWAVAMPC